MILFMEDGISMEVCRISIMLVQNEILEDIVVIALTSVIFPNRGNFDSENVTATLEICCECTDLKEILCLDVTDGL